MAMWSFFSWWITYEKIELKGYTIEITIYMRKELILERIIVEILPKSKHNSYF
jgi:hypothetical protein